MASVVIHIKTGKVYFLLKLFAINATNNFEGENYAIYKRPFKKDIFVRRTYEFCDKFTTLKEWRIKNK